MMFPGLGDDSEDGSKDFAYRNPRFSSQDHIVPRAPSHVTHRKTKKKTEKEKYFLYKY